MTLASLDRRTRNDSDLVDLGPTELFATVLPELAEANGHLVVAGIAALDAPPIAFVVDGDPWTVQEADGSLLAERGAVDGAMVLTFDRAQFSDWAQGQRSLNAMWVGGELRREGGRQRDVSSWDSLWVALLDGWPVVDPDLVFLDRDGQPLELDRSFRPDDDVADVAHFLREAGYAHLEGWLDPGLMAVIAADMDDAVTSYQPGDERSWWATVADGAERCVRMQHFVDRSEATADLLRSDLWQQLRRAIAGDDDVVQAPVEGNCIEALVKPLAVVAGISDVPWHRDCNFGRHAYQCCGIIVGISVTGADDKSGQLRVVAGSNRLAMPADLASIEPYLPIVPLATQTGDITVHLSCTLHEAVPPVERERKVMYTGFGLAPRPGQDAEGGRALSALRERIHTEVSQTASPLTGA